MAPAEGLSSAKDHQRASFGAWLREETTLPDRTTTAQHALDRHHDQYAPLGKVRRVAWPVEDDEPAVAHDFDPFT